MLIRTKDELSDDSYYRNYVGLEKILSDEFFSKQVPNYPPYNYYMSGENEYVIELALAGFSKEDVEVKKENDKLSVYSKNREIPKDSPKERGKYPAYFHHGIARRSFHMSWKLMNNVEVKVVKFKDGVLRIDLVRNVPEEQKPRLIPIE